MKEKILRVLREENSQFVSGQKLCQLLGVTRQAVWKNIAQLKEQGFEIASVSNKGYQLVSSPDILYEPDIASRMSEDCICRKIECHSEIDSTNIRAKQLAELGEPEGTLVVADKQSAGKGRRGRGWSSEAGTGIYMSLIVRPEIEPQFVSGLTLIAALAQAGAIKNLCGADAQIKWPNDIVLGKKKICGILTEMSSEMNYIHYAVIGIGINVNTEFFSEEIRDKASSIYEQTGKKTDRAALVAETMERFGSYYKKFLETGSLAPFVDEYNSMLANRDQMVKVLNGMAEDANSQKIDTGIAKGIDSGGALIVETERGTIKVVSGEVSVRGMYGYV